jgi:tetratricopeptide (TPR) repeat protein
VPRENEVTHHLSGHAAHQSRFFQQATGIQYNADTQFIATAPTRAQIPTVSDWPRLSQIDPLDYGVHRAASVDGSSLTAYVARDQDPTLRERLRVAQSRGGFVLVVGDSTAGKTRSTLHIMAEMMPEWRVFAPDNVDELAAAITAFSVEQPPAVLFLDDLDRFIGIEGLHASTLRYLKSKHVPVVATIRTEQFQRLTAKPSSTDVDGHQHTEDSGADVVLRMTEPVLLDRMWSDAETGRARSAKDFRLQVAAQHHTQYGLAEYVAAGPQLLQQWRLARETSSQRRGAAIVSAAIDCMRAGYFPISADALRKLHVLYLRPDEAGTLQSGDFEQSLSWATELRLSVASLLRVSPEANDSFLPFDYLVDEIEKQEEGSFVPLPTWQFLVEDAEPSVHALNRMATAAAIRGQEDLAIQALTVAAKAGDANSQIRLSSLCYSRGNTDDAEKWLLAAANTGSARAALRLGRLYEDKKSFDQAERWFRTAWHRGDPHAASHLGVLLHHLSRSAEAESVLREVLSRDDYALVGLSGLLADQQRVEEAEELLIAARRTNAPGAGTALGILYDSFHRKEDARTAWHGAAEAGSRAAMANLALSYADDGNVRDAVRWLEAAVIEGEFPRLQVRVGVKLAVKNKGLEAEPLLRAEAEAGDAEAARGLAVALDVSGRSSEALPWARLAAGAKVQGSVASLGIILENAGQVDEAILVLRSAIATDPNDFPARMALGETLVHRKEYEEAVTVVEPVADAGKLRESIECNFGLALRETGQYERAELHLKNSAAQGHEHALCRLGTLYLKMERLAEAESAWREAYGRGHKHAAHELAALLSQTGRKKSAARWRRLAFAPTSTAPNARTRPHAQRRPKQKGKRRKR